MSTFRKRITVADDQLRSHISRSHSFFSVIRSLCSHHFLIRCEQGTMKALERLPQKPKITAIHLLFNKGISTSIRFSYAHHPAVLHLLRTETFTMDLLEKYASLAIQDWIPLHITLSSIAGADI